DHEVAAHTEHEHDVLAVTGRRCCTARNAESLAATKRQEGCLAAHESFVVALQRDAPERGARRWECKQARKATSAYQRIAAAVRDPNKVEVGDDELLSCRDRVGRDQHRVPLLPGEEVLRAEPNSGALVNVGARNRVCDIDVRGPLLVNSGGAASVRV